MQNLVCSYNQSCFRQKAPQSLASNSNRSLILGRRYLFSLDLDSCEQEEEVELDYPLKNPRMTTRVLGSCNGLLCISNSDEEILLWNPSIRRHHEVPFTPIEFPVRLLRSDLRHMFYGFGYDPTTDDYKLIRVVEFYDDDDYPYSCDSEVKVYSLCTNSWRRILDMPYYLTCHCYYGVLANYALHWVAMRKTGPDTTSSFIVSFELRDEEYREVPLPDYVGDGFYMNLGVLGGQLCLLRIFSKVGVEVWVMKDYGVRDSWVKQSSLEQSAVIWPFCCIRPICYTKNGEVILDKYTADKAPLILYDPRSRSVWNIRLCDARDRNGAEICIGSLLLLDTKDGAQQTAMKKRQSEDDEDGSGKFKGRT
ncbi:F-box protein CPR1-like isoform X2 [Macadamia integrifolia]|uniref:F-box protein CPR1-like isoform X2 n=1 Tax=Macadamia integrifolia TaxID=60698 RepID=UPI001C4F1283|nr:F-box protein CPR1-like isoform X2 [Macadamia integrifolia]